MTDQTKSLVMNLYLAADALEGWGGSAFSIIPGGICSAVGAVPTEQHGRIRAAGACPWPQWSRAESCPSDAGKPLLPWLEVVHVSAISIQPSWVSWQPQMASVHLQEILRQTVLACNELLRHFWAQFPLSTSKRVSPRI